MMRGASAKMPPFATGMIYDIFARGSRVILNFRKQKEIGKMAIDARDARVGLLIYFSTTT